MTKTRQNKEDTGIPSGEENSIVYWIRKIHDKIELIETKQQENSDILKNQQDSFERITSEISVLNRHVLETGCPNRKSAQIVTTKPNFSSIIQDKCMQKLMSERKFAYYNQLRSGGIAATYRNFLK